MINLAQKMHQNQHSPLAVRSRVPAKTSDTMEMHTWLKVNNICWRGAVLSLKASSLLKYRQTNHATFLYSISAKIILTLNSVEKMCRCFRWHLHFLLMSPLKHWYLKIQLQECLRLKIWVLFIWEAQLIKMWPQLFHGEKLQTQL